MILTSLRTSTLSKAGFDWYVGFVSAFDSRDETRLEPFLHQDAVFELNNYLPFYGKRTVCMALSQFWQGVEGIEHEPINIYGDDNQFAAELLSHYVRREGGAPITVPVAAFYDRDASGLLISSRMFIDLTPVFETRDDR